MSEQPKSIITWILGSHMPFIFLSYEADFRKSRKKVKSDKTVKYYYPKWCFGVNMKQVFNIKSSATFWGSEESHKNCFGQIRSIFCTDNYDLMWKYFNERY